MVKQLYSVMMGKKHNKISILKDSYISKNLGLGPFSCLQSLPRPTIQLRYECTNSLALSWDLQQTVDNGRQGLRKSKSYKSHT